MEYRTASKRKEILAAVTTWMNLKDLLLSHKGQMPYDSAHPRSLEESRSQRQAGGYQGLGGDGGSVFNGDRGSIWKDEMNSRDGGW